MNNKDKHTELILFGFKIRYVQKKHRDLLAPYRLAQKNNVDITTVPPITGQSRQFQLAGLAMLIDFDKICKQNNITYWLDFGTLLGAIRHKGFIPWDDDIDLGMFRNDYDKLFEVVNNNTVNTDIFADYNINGHFIKIKHKKCHDLFLDIFPVDEYGEIISEEEQLKKTVEIKNSISSIYSDNYEFKDNFEKKREAIFEVRKNLLNNLKPEDTTKTQYVWGVDFPHNWKNWFTNYEEYFPFKTIKFEGFEFPCMNDPDTYLRKVYGNYMAYPKNLFKSHNIYNNRCKEEKNIIKNIVNEKGLK